MAQAGKIAGYEWVSNFTGTDGGMFLVGGDPQVLLGIAMSPEFGSFHQRGTLHLEDRPRAEATEPRFQRADQRSPAGIDLIDGRRVAVTRRSGIRCGAGTAGQNRPS